MAARGSTTIVLVDDAHMLREAVRCVLERERGFAVVGEAASGRQALRLVARWRPRVLIAAARRPDADGYQVIRRVRRRAPDTATVVLGGDGGEEAVLGALRAGADAYVATGAPVRELLRAIRAVRAGRRHVSDPGSRWPLETWLRRVAEGGSDGYERLTGRERQVLRLAAEGLSSARIGRRLAISRRTAEAHRANAMRKLGLAGLAALVRYAVGRGIVPPLGGSRPT